MSKVAFKIKKHQQQSGQAIVLILLLCVFGVLGVIALISTGILTNEKMQLQNAADATAYSVSVLEARDLNYTAYMNRAKVANEVAIGQMVSLSSWANMLKTEPKYLSLLGTMISSIPTPVTGAIGAGLSGYARVIDRVYPSVKKGVNGISKKVSLVLYNLNAVYTGSQKLIHYSTLVFSLTAIHEIPKSNMSKPYHKSLLSKFGLLSLMTHYVGYYGGDLGIAGYSFLKSPKKTESGIERFSQVINDSRDAFTKNRACDPNSGGLAALKSFNIKSPRLEILGHNFMPISIELKTPAFDCREGQGGWDFNMIDITVKAAVDINLGFFGGGFSVDLQLNSDIKRRGGTQLMKSNDQYIWSAADVAEIDAKSKGSFSLYGWVYVPTWRLTPPYFRKKYASTGASLTLNFPGYPYGVGDSNIGDSDYTSPTGNNAQLKKMYGGSSRLTTAWTALRGKPPFAEHTSMGDGYRLGGNSLFSGYNMVSKTPDILQKTGKNSIFIGMEAPYILIGLTKSKSDIFDNNINAPTGNFALTESHDGLSKDTLPIAVIGKAEVYYSQPADLDYFSIKGKRRGAANAFNPYWDARLVDTSYLDRIAALALQSEQLPLSGGMLKLYDSIKNFKFLLAKAVTP